MKALQVDFEMDRKDISETPGRVSVTIKTP
jgi:hypothetical protein